MKKEGRKVKEVVLNITSMMDMLTMLLFFLIMSFDPQNANKTINKDLSLPKSNSQRKFEVNGINLAMTKEALVVEDKKILELTSGEFNKLHLDGDRILPLFEILEKKRKIMEEEKKSRLPEGKAGVIPKDDKKEEEEFIVFFQGDKSLPYKILNKIMITSAMAGFPTFKFAVIPE